MAKLPKSTRLIINFHGIGEIPNYVDASEAPYWCSQSAFEDILDRIPDISRGASIPIEITFDDGNESDARIALPALVRRGLRARFFICAGRLGTTGYVDQKAMQDLLAAGMAIGSHGWSHVDWRRASNNELHLETHSALDKLSSAIQKRIDEVGIPFGSYDRRVLNKLRQCGIRTAYTSDGGLAKLPSWLAPRNSFNAKWIDTTLRDLATSRPNSVVAIRRHIRNMLKSLL